MYVIKRTGETVPFDATKIAVAIEKAIIEVEGTGNEAWAVELAREVVGLLDVNDGIWDIEEIQDLVEYVLVAQGFYSVAKAYILYREQRRQLREMKTLVSVDLIGDYLGQADWRVNENANSSFSLQGLHSYLANTAAAHYWLEKIYPPSIREAHRSGAMHIHDLGYISTYCMGWDLKQLLEEGFGGVPNQVSSAPARHFRTALGQMVNFLFTVQGEIAGAVAFSGFDTHLAPFVRADGLTQREVYQGIQEFVYNMNVPTRTGYQTPFSNITMDLTVPPMMQNEPAIVGGKPYGVYGDFQLEMDMINRAFAQVMTYGDNLGRGFSFPIPTYNVTKDLAWTPVMMDIMTMTAKYGTPYFANFINSDLKPEDVRSMCCRLRIDNTELQKRGGGLFGANPMTGSIGVVTLNLPRLAYRAKDEKEFFKLLHQVTTQAKNSLEIKRGIIEQMTDLGLYPYTKRYMRNIKEARGSYWANHFSTIGVIGGNEACLNLLGVGIGSPEGHAFIHETLEFLRVFIVRAQIDTGNLYNLEATPGEGTAYRLARLDKKAYSSIIVANEEAWAKGGEPYYTNSTMLPVGYTDNIGEMLFHQETLQPLYTGGTVAHLFMGEDSPDPAGCFDLVKRVLSSTEIPYISLTPTYSICPDHGYVAGEQPSCPQCGVVCEVYSRVVGYYRPVTQWNRGKQAEYADRKLYVPDPVKLEAVA